MSASVENLVVPSLDRFSHHHDAMLSIPRGATKVARLGTAMTPANRFIGPYELLEQLGQGGMATVFRARHRDGDHDVVVKAMLPHLARIPQLVQMFESEARLTSQLRHDNIVQVQSYGIDDDDTPYLVMELLDGKNLSQLRVVLHKAERRMPVSVAVRIAYDLCLALGCAHDFVGDDGESMQVIHRDVSPSNVMLQRDGSVKLLDFGVAKLSSAAGQAVTSSLKGKFAYMAPEQVNQQPIDRRCDVFAAGIVLHEMLVGRRLFGCKSEMETLRRVAACEVQPPSHHNADVPVELDAVVLRALSLDPADRFENGDEMAAALAALGPLADRRELAAFLKVCVPSLASDPWMARQRKVEDALAASVVTDLDRTFNGDPDETDEPDEPTHARRAHLHLVPTPEPLDVSIEIELLVEEMTDHSFSAPITIKVEEAPSLFAPSADVEQWSKAEPTVPARPRPSKDVPVDSWTAEAPALPRPVLQRRKRIALALAGALVAISLSTVALVATQGADMTSEPAASAPK